MTVEPGFGGQTFMEDIMEKIEILRKHSAEINIEVDGGIDLNTITKASKAGANMFVVGSFIFKSSNIKETISLLKEKCYEI
jgi:ribulose-phosphate 3-epimerase